MARRFVEVHDRNPYGEDFDESLMEDAGIDSTFIEGYSDIRKERELAVRNGTIPPAPLRHRLQWARAKSFDGQTNDGRRMHHWQTKKHYKTLRYDEAIEMGYNLSQNPAIKKGEDGLAYLGYQVLMYADGPTAAANLKKVMRDTEEQKERPKQKMQEAVERFNKDTKGAHAEAFSFIGDDPEKP